jgi:hypothetical protein
MVIAQRLKLALLGIVIGLLAALVVGWWELLCN